MMFDHPTHDIMCWFLHHIDLSYKNKQHMLICIYVEFQMGKAHILPNQYVLIPQKQNRADFQNLDVLIKKQLS